MDGFSSFFVSFATVIVLLANLQSSKTQQSYCWDPCQFECEQKSPRLCPPETILTYYDCCLDGCCPCIKWSNLLFLTFIAFLLLAGCCCCAFFLLTDSRQRMFRKQQQKEATEKSTQKNANRKRDQSERKKGRDGTGLKPKKYSTTIV